MITVKVFWIKSNMNLMRMQENMIKIYGQLMKLKCNKSHSQRLQVQQQQCFNNKMKSKSSMKLLLFPIGNIITLMN
jgi:hypothetical protein